MGNAESILRDVEGLNPSYMTVSFKAVHKIVLRPHFSTFLHDDLRGKTMAKYVKAPGAEDEIHR